MHRRALRHGAFTLCVCLSGGKEGGFAKTPFFLSSSPWAERGSLRFGRTGRDKSLHRQGFHIQIQRGDAGPQQCVAKIPHGEWPARTQALRDVLQAKLGLCFRSITKNSVVEPRRSRGEGIGLTGRGSGFLWCGWPRGLGLCPAWSVPAPRTPAGGRPAPRSPGGSSGPSSAGRGAAVGPQPRGAVGCPGRAVP